MSTVFEALAAIAGHLPGISRGLATGGGEWYITDTNRLTRHADDVFIYGALFLLTGDCEGAILPITDSVQSTGRVDGDEGVYWSQAASEAPAAGDRYLATLNAWPAGDIIAAFDEAVRHFGKVETLATLGTGDGEETAFALPGSLSGTVVRVYITNDDQNDVRQVEGWEETSTGIELIEVVPTDYVVTAVVVHEPDGFDTLTLTGTVSAPISLDYIAWYGAYALMRNKMLEPGYDNDKYEGMINHAADMYQAEIKRRAFIGVRSRERFRI